MAFGSILKEEPMERKFLSDIKLRQAQGERKIPLENQLHLPYRYLVILEQLCKTLRLNYSEFVNAWLERSIEIVLEATRIHTRGDDLGLLTKQARRNLFNFSLGRVTLDGQSAITRDSHEVKNARGN